MFNPSPPIVSLKVYDVLGREITTLVNKRQTAGIYFYSLKAGNFRATKKMILLK